LFKRALVKWNRTDDKHIDKRSPDPFRK